VTDPASPSPATGDTRAAARPWGRRGELWAALGLTAVILSFHLERVFYAGGLWRDEAATAYLARHFSLHYALLSVPYDWAPMLVPAVLRGFTWLAGGGDTAFRAFGLLVGCGITAVLWWNMRVMGRGVPLLSLALLGFNGAFLIWQDEVRSYGPGLLMLLLTAGLVWRAIESPSPARVAAAALGGVGCAQTLFQNGPMLLAVCLAAAVTALRRRNPRRAILALALGAPAAASLLIYAAPIRGVQNWIAQVRVPVTLGHLVAEMNEVASSSGGWNTWIWLALIAAAVALSLADCGFRSPVRTGCDQDLLLYTGLAAAGGVVAHLIFLKASALPTHPWYYLGPLALAGLFVDVAFDAAPRLIRASRLPLAAAIAVGSLVPTWQDSQMRMTNIDLVASALRSRAGDGDLIILGQWFCASSFDRYDHGTAPCLTIPPIASRELHRFDLVRQMMLMPDQSQPIRPVLDRIAQTLKGGHRVWVAGTIPPLPPGKPIPTLDPAPDPKWGWRDDVYLWVWDKQLAAFLRDHASRSEDASVQFNGPIFDPEDLPLTVFDGWSGQ
jgi:hypothetical protein